MHKQNFAEENYYETITKFQPNANFAAGCQNRRKNLQLFRVYHCYSPLTCVSSVLDLQLKVSIVAQMQGKKMV
jgi:hypothetical protein